MSTGPPPQKPEGATTVFVLGLLGLLLCAPIGIFGWTQGNDYIRRCQAAGVEPDGLGVAGRILGMIATCLLILSVIMFVGMMLLGVLGAAVG